MNVKLFRKIFQLCEDYQKTSCLTPTEFVSAFTDTLDEDALFHFLNVQRHNQILQEISEHFKKYYNVTININMTRIKVLFYILISAFDPENTTGIEQIFIVVNKISYVNNILLYYADEQNQIITAQIASKYFDNDYAMKNFIMPIMNNAEFYREIFDYVNEYEYKHLHKELTIPLEMNVAKKSMKIPAVPLNTPAEIELFHGSKIPRSTYIPDVNLQKKLRHQYEKNQEKAIRLLEQAKSMKEYRTPKKSEPPEPKMYLPPFKRPKQIFVRKDVPIKANLTTVMREAALYAKEKESCIREINDILKGGVDTNLTKSFEKEMREMKEKKELEEIERKRLKCLLSHEEAVIAKCKLRENNQKKKIEFLEEREKLMKKLDNWRVQEKEKYKNYVQKAHESNRNAKQSEKKMIEEKQCNARYLQWESKRLMNKAMEEKEKELARKIHIIQEIKAISQVRAIDVTREFDKSECPNLGLLCEMSIAELEERLYLMKVKMQQELNEKRECILKKKEEKKKMVEEAKYFIEQNRTVKQKPQVYSVTSFVESPDIIDLRKKLETAKKMRQACNFCPCEPCPVILKYGNNK